MDTIQAVLADANATIRTGVRALLNSADDIRIVGEADNGDTALRLANQLAPDVLVLELRLPDIDGIEVVKRLRSANSKVRCLLFCVNASKDKISEALSAGANGFLTKEEGSALLAEAIRGVMNTDCWLSPLAEQEYRSTRNT